MTLDDFASVFLTAAETAMVNDRLVLLAAYSGAAETTANNRPRQMVENLRSESRLSEVIWRDLCDTIIASGPDGRQVYNAVVSWGRSHVLWLVCPRMGPNTVYAHCVPLRRFCERKASKRWLGVDAGAATRRIDALLKKSFPEQQAQLAKEYLGDYQMWATFRHDAPTEDPMSYLPPDRASLCAWLGLQRKLARMRMLVFRYRLGTGTTVSVPTVATAAASWPWNEHWRATAHTGHGWTKPWDGYPGAQACPEVVHAPITGSQLYKEILSPQ